MAIQIYGALIAALMLQPLTGKRPGKRAMELIQLYLMGYAELEEVITLLAPKKQKPDPLKGGRHQGARRGLPCPDTKPAVRPVRESPAKRRHL